MSTKHCGMLAAERMQIPNADPLWYGPNDGMINSSV